MEIIIKSPTHGNHVVLIDDDDYDKVINYTWCIFKPSGSKSFYVGTNIKKDGKFKIQTLHRIILNYYSDKFIDHINHNTLDNRKCNLRICTNLENQRNQVPRNKESSKYKGVHKPKRENKYIAQIKINGVNIPLGRHAKEVDAAKSYNEAAIKYFGEFALLNNISEE